MRKLLSCDYNPRFYNLCAGKSKSLILNKSITSDDIRVPVSNYTKHTLYNRNVSLSGNGVVTLTIDSNNEVNLPANTLYEVYFYCSGLTNWSNLTTLYGSLNSGNSSDNSQISYIHTDTGTGVGLTSALLPTIVRFNYHEYVYQAANNGFRIDLQDGDYIEVGLERKNDLNNNLKYITLHYNIYAHSFTLYSVSYYSGTPKTEYISDAILYRSVPKGVKVVDWNINAADVDGPYSFPIPEYLGTLIVLLPVASKSIGYYSADSKTFTSFTLPASGHTWTNVTFKNNLLFALDLNSNDLLRVDFNYSTPSSQIIPLNNLLGSNAEIVCTADYILIKGKTKILKSSNGGLTWNIKLNNAYYDLIGHLVYSPVFNSWYITALIDDVESGYYSSDSGDTWHECPTGDLDGGYYTDYVCYGDMIVTFMYKTYNGTSPGTSAKYLVYKYNSTYRKYLWHTGRAFTTSSPISKVQCINGTFIAIPGGNTNKIYTSTDLDNWTEHTVTLSADWPLFIPAAETWYSSVSGNSYQCRWWVSIVKATSVNTLNLLLYDMSNGSIQNSLSEVDSANDYFKKSNYKYANGYYIAYDNSSTTTNAIYTSINGYIWDKVSLSINRQLSNIIQTNFGLFAKDIKNNCFIKSVGLSRNAIESPVISDQNQLYSKSWNNSGGGGSMSV